MAARVTLALATVLTALVPTPAYADTVILLDRSGSMKSYYANREKSRIRELVTQLIEAVRTVEEPDLVAFNTEHRELAGVGEVATVVDASGNTNLTGVLNSHIDDYDTIWILTDNVQDVGVAGDMHTFYEALQAPAVHAIYVVPIRNEVLPNTSGVIVYAISTVEQTAQLERQVGRFQELLGRSSDSRLLMKPLAENVITTVLDDPDKVLPFSEGDPLSFAQTIRIVRGKEFSHLAFASSPVKTDRAVNPFVGNSCLVAERHVSAISPDKVATDGTTEIYTVKVDFGRVRLRWTPECLVTAAFRSRSEPAVIQTPLEIEVEDTNLQLSRAFLNDYVASSPENAVATGKISGLDRLPSFIAPSTIRIGIGVNRQVKIAYPLWPAVVLVLGGLLLAGVVVVAAQAVTAAARPKLRVIAETQDGQAVAASLEDGEVRVRDTVVGRVDGEMFTPAPGVLLESAVSAAPIAGPVLCALPSGERVHLRFTRRRRAPEEERRGPSDPEEPAELTRR